MDKLAQQLGINFDLYSGFILWALLFTRILVTVMLTPFLGGRSVPGRIRFLTSGLLATFVFFVMKDNPSFVLPNDKGILVALFFKEIFFGLAIGTTAIMCFYAIEAGGRIVDNQRGSANAQIFVPQLGQVSIFGLLQFWLAMAIFLSLGGHIKFLQAFMDGFQIVPVTVLPHIAPGFSPFLEFLIRLSADVLVLGLQLAAPVLVSIFLTDIVLGLANKMAPQIPVFELGFMLKGYVGVTMVYFSILVIVSQMKVYCGTMIDDVHKIFLLFAR